MSAISARNLIKRALKEIRVLGVGQSVNSEVEQDAFLDLNNLLESLSLDNNKIYAETEETQTLTSGTARYTVGSGGDFNTNRPLEIKSGDRDIFIRDSGGTDYPVRLVTQDIYRAKTSKTSSGRPSIMSYTPEFPLGKISLYPTPDNSTDVLHYRARVLLTSFDTLTTEVNFAPGYERAIIAIFAAELAPAKGKTVSVELAAKINQAWSFIERNNARRIGEEPVKLDDMSRMLSGRGRNTIYEGPYA